MLNEVFSYFDDIFCVRRASLQLLILLSFSTYHYSSYSLILSNCPPTLIRYSSPNSFKSIEEIDLARLIFDLQTDLYF